MTLTPTNTTITANWTVSGTLSVIDFYRVICRTDGNVPLLLQTSEQHLFISGLSPNTSYVVCVETFMSNRNTSSSLCQKTRTTSGGGQGNSKHQVFFRSFEFT